MKKAYALLLAFLLTGLIASNLYLFNLSNKGDIKLENVILARVIDGDTLVLNDGRHLRLLNINSPEKSSPLSEKSASFLRQFENKSINVQIAGIDKYYRNLARIYSIDSIYLNLELVKNGLASKFLVDSNELSIFANAESKAIENSRGIWNKSDYFGCFISKIDQKNEIVYLKNICNRIKMEKWYIKDESRKIYLFRNITLGEIILHSFEGEDNETDVFWNSKQDIWNNDRDSIYLFDSENKIAYYKAYGY
jgi:endonuclease YncB( thermonuclease family)